MLGGGKGERGRGIGPAASQLSYVNKQKILQVAKASGAQVGMVCSKLKLNSH